MAEQIPLQQAFDETWGKKSKKREDWDRLYEQWNAQQTPEQLREVIRKLDPVIGSAVSSYAGPKASPTIHQRAKLLAADAVRTYDPERGAGLNTHVYNQLRALQRMAPQVTDPLAPPERFRRQQQEITQANESFFDEMGREPTDEEIAEVTGIPPKRITKVRNRMRARIPISAYEESFDEDDEAADIVGSERTEYDDWVDAVYDDLGEIDRLIMMHRTGYRNADVLSNQEIAQKLDVSPAAVSQRVSRIQKRLDEFHAAS